MNPFLIGFIFVAGAVGLFSYAVLADPVPRISRDRRVGHAEPHEPLLRRLYQRFVGLIERAMRSRGWVPFRASELEQSDVTMSPATLVTWIGFGSAAALGLGAFVGRSVILGVFLAILVPVGAKIWLRIKAGQRRRKFVSQLDGTLQMMASSLRSGQSFPMALDSCAREADDPMSDELARIVNENRLGRDLIEAMEDTAGRMQCEDFLWISEAVAITRDSGGNLNEIIDRVAETIRERAEIRERIAAYASEGRFSSYVLMCLPIVVGVVYSFVSPGYLEPLFVTGLGRLLLAGSAVLFAAAYFWMRAIVDIKI